YGADAFGFGGEKRRKFWTGLCQRPCDETALLARLPVACQELPAPALPALRASLGLHREPVQNAARFLGAFVGAALGYPERHRAQLVLARPNDRPRDDRITVGGCYPERPALRFPESR